MISCVKFTQAKIINTLPQLTFCSSMRGFTRGLLAGGCPRSDVTPTCNHKLLTLRNVVREVNN